MQKETDKQQKTARLILDHSPFPRASWMLIPVKQKGNPTVSVLKNKLCVFIYLEKVDSSEK